MAYGSINQIPRGQVAILLPPARRIRVRPPIGGRTHSQGLLQTVGVLETVLRPFGEAAENDAFEIGGHAGLQRRGRRHLVASMGD